MLRALWFLVKLSLLVSAMVWLSVHSGTVEISWMGYLIETSVGFVIIILAVLMVTVAMIYRFWRGFVSVPAILRRHSMSQAREQGYIAVTKGLVAIAAGDAGKAEKQLRRAQKMIPDTPLTKLLSAQTNLMKGDGTKARAEFTELLDDDTAAFFGVRALLTENLRDGNYKEALVLVRRAEKLQPKRLWVIKTLFDLEARNKEWAKAESTLAKAERLGVWDKKESMSHRQALLTARADEAFMNGNLSQAVKFSAKALDLDLGFTPAALRLVKSYQQLGKRHKAIKAILKIWAAAPHPDLADIWRGFQPPAPKSKSAYDDGKPLYTWMKQLFDTNPLHPDSIRMLGVAALEARMFREAREYLMQVRDYRQLAKLETAETGNETKAREWLEIAAETPADPKWVCQSCGQAALDWNALCHNCLAFNQYQWLIPSVEMREASKTLPVSETVFISPPSFG
jgi:HemY protein